MYVVTGFYRVSYDKKMTQLLQKQFNLDHNVISPLTRSQIVDDHFAMATQSLFKVLLVVLYVLPNIY